MRIAAVVAALGLLLSGCGFSLQGLAGAAGGSGGTYRLDAEFADAAKLPVGGIVRIGQSSVGTVSALRAQDFRAIVTLAIDEGVRLPAGTTARLELTSALGEEYVVLEPPSTPGPPLAEGAVIGMAQTSRGPDVENTLAMIGTLLNGSGIDQVRTIVTELSKALGGREQKVRDLLSGLTTTLGTMEAHRADFANTVDAVHSLSGRLNGDRATLEAAYRRIRPAVDVLVSERARFTSLLDNVTGAANSARDLVRDTGGAFTDRLREFQPTLVDLATSGNRLDGALRSVNAFADKIKRATPGDYLLFDGTLDLPHTVEEVLNPAGIAPPRGPLGGILSGPVR